MSSWKYPPKPAPKTALLGNYGKLALVAVAAISVCLAANEIVEFIEDLAYRAAMDAEIVEGY